jgi:hypothetical protein
MKGLSTLYGCTSFEGSHRRVHERCGGIFSAERIDMKLFVLGMDVEEGASDVPGSVKVGLLFNCDE